MNPHDPQIHFTAGSLARGSRVRTMDVGRPAPDEELNTGDETVPRPAATVMLLGGGSGQLEVLMV
jgi:hypothetical protein